MIKKMRLPVLALSALLFYTTLFVLIMLNILPPIHAGIDKIQEIYANLGPISFFFAALLEGLVYIGLYFPGTTFIVLGIILFQGGYINLIWISILVTVALIVASVFNYLFGRNIARRNVNKVKKELDVTEESQTLSKWLLLTCLHPGAMSFYVFNSGIKKHHPMKLLIIPFILVPYYFLAFVVIYSLKGYFQSLAERPYLIFVAIFLWICVEFFILNKEQFKKQEQYRKGIFMVTIFEHNGKREYLLLKRKLHWKGWEFPKGGRKENESITDAVIRETQEETGQTPVSIQAFPFTGKYRYQKKIASRKGMVGQDFKLFLVKLKEKTITLDTKEHSEYEWVSFDKAIQKVTWPNQKTCLEIVGTSKK